NSHLAVLGLILKAAVKRKLIAANPVGLADRPREQAREWKVLRPEEVGAIVRAYDELVRYAETDHERDDARMSRMLFMVAVELGPRRSELRGLKWHSLALADPEAGPTLRVSETIVYGRADTPKSRQSRRTLRISSRLAEELFDLLAWTPFSEPGHHVF